MSEVLLEQIIGIVRELIEKYHNEKSEVDSQSDLFDELSFDSMLIISLVVKLEEVLGVEINEDDLVNENFATPEKIYNLLHSYSVTL